MAQTFVSTISSLASKINRWVSAILRFFNKFLPLTLPGFLLTGLAVLTLYFIAQPGHDLVLSVIGYGFLCLTLLLSGISLFAAYLLRRTLTLQAFVGIEKPISQLPIPITLRVHSFRIPPLFSLSLRLHFRTDTPSSQTIVLTGAVNPERLLVVTSETVFPHRGFWELDHAEVTLSDAVGITSVSWSIALHTTCEVHPAELDIQGLPITAESSRSGELSQYTRERTGDPFDMKAYDPSDGIRRVLWKTYARSGQLYVRRQEPAIIPEGELPVFIIATPEEDEVAAAALCFLAQLEREEIVAMLGTDGLIEGPSHSRYVVGLEMATEALNRQAMDIDAGSGKDLDGFIESLIADGKIISRVVVFGGSSNTLWTERSLQTLSLRGLQASLVTVPVHYRHEQELAQTLPPKLTSNKILLRLFPSRSKLTNLPSNNYYQHASTTGTQYLECERRK